MVQRLLPISTPALAASFLIVSGTGSLMFLHIAQKRLENLHQWAGAVLVLLAGLHVLRNWSGLVAYGRRGIALYVSLGIATLGAAAFLVVAFQGDRKTGRDVLRERMEQASLTELAPILDESPEQLVLRLKSAGFVEVTAGASPARIAATSQASTFSVLDALVRGTTLDTER